MSEEKPRGRPKEEPRVIVGVSLKPEEAALLDEVGAETGEARATLARRGLLAWLRIERARLRRSRTL